MAKPTNSPTTNARQLSNDSNAGYSDRLDHRQRSSVRHACRNAVLQAWIDETDQELFEALKSGRARVASVCDQRRNDDDFDFEDFESDINPSFH